MVKSNSVKGSVTGKVSRESFSCVVRNLPSELILYLSRQTRNVVVQKSCKIKSSVLSISSTQKTLEPGTLGET